MATRDEHAPPGTTLHSAPLVVPIGGPPVRFGAVAVRGGRVLAVGTRKDLAARHPRGRERRWPGMLVAGLVDAHTRLGRAPRPADAAGDLLRHGVVAVGDVAHDAEHPADPGVVGLGGATYLEVRCPDERTWEETGRDRLITAIREVALPRAIGVAAHTRDPGVLEDLAIMARTFGLRLHAELAGHQLTVLDETGVLGPHTHLTHGGRLDTGERKLLRLRGAPVALSPLTHPEDVAVLVEEGNAVALHTTPGEPDLLAAARVFMAANGRDERLARAMVEAATVGGARALGLDEGPGRIGTLGPGGRADFAVFEVARARRGAYTALVEDGPGRCVATVVGGRVRWDASRPAARRS
ncbi:hypothetical protein Misp01_29420 [Microtetraspora sp. NBRC 13810]|uniref:amidohydrolase family protein n=1 Tax=Microtetraspora sp. NBRC 13810 TaxID=3030990 RepID=UPI00249FC72E|nr:amidohydrolase family protein [Microtetraspora sp. NBRC 13810]GLW07812.1 hypothetical protein Misp01_29420 [Microtetraspora sp. NBRC 13810]